MIITSYGVPLAVAAVGVMQALAMGCVFAFYWVRDRYAHDCDHGDHKLIAIGAQTPVDLGAAFTAKRTTVILFRCRYCTVVESQTVEGAWPLDQVRAWGNGIIPDSDWAPGQPDPEPEPSGAPS